MSGTGEVTADFAGEARVFRIGLGEIRRIQSKCGDVGIGEVARRLARCVLLSAKLPMLEALASGVEIHADDVREVLYQGLVAGKMSVGAATRLISAEIDDRGLPGLIAAAPIALEVLLGSQETPPGEPQAGESPASAAATPESP